jgi:hypothetical protein
MTSLRQAPARQAENFYSTPSAGMKWTTADWTAGMISPKAIASGKIDSGNIQHSTPNIQFFIGAAGALDVRC